MRARCIFPIALAPLVMATSCPAVLTVQVFPQGSRVDPPVFVLWNASDSSGTVVALEVRECAEGGAPMWRITRQAPALPGSQRVVYGEAHPEFAEAAPARPLARGGCYRAIARPIDPERAVGQETFRLLPTGGLVVGTPKEPLMEDPALRELNRAAVDCVRGYRRADSAADSAAVDAREHPVRDARLSCGWIREHWPDDLRTTRTRGEHVLTLAVEAAFLLGIFALDHALDSGAR